ncbi:oxidative DNA demethylase [Allomyces javanicus]|nr:oxidative DNA demethylase [Allomyces javanicus]
MTGDRTTTTATTTSSSWDETHLRSALQAQLRRSGVVDQLRAQLRARIIEQLHPDSGVPGAGFRGRPRGGDATVIHTIVNALVTEFLAHQGLEYTLSVYLPETSQTLPPKVADWELLELLHLDQIQASSSLGRLESALDYSRRHGLSWIESLVKGVRELHVPCLSQQVQTEETDHERALRECAELVEVERESKRRAVLEVQRKYELLMEERVQQEVLKQVERFRDVEVKHVRLEAKEDWMRKMDAYKVELDAKHGERERQFLEEMEVAEARSKQREMELDAAQMDLDRRLAVAQEAIQLKEEKLQHQQELIKQSRSIEETVTRRKIEDLQSQVNQLISERDAAQRRLSDEVKRARDELQNQLRSQEVNLQAELRVLGEKRKVVDRYLREEESLRDNLEQARATISDLQHQVSSLQAEVGDARKRNAQMARSKPSRDERQELHALKAEFNLISATLAEHKEKVGLLKQSERKWQLECQQLIGQFEHERRRAKALAKRLHQEIEAKRDAEAEASQLRFLIKQQSIRTTRLHPVHSPSNDTNRHRHWPPSSHDSSITNGSDASFHSSRYLSPVRPVRADPDPVSPLASPETPFLALSAVDLRPVDQSAHRFSRTTVLARGGAKDVAAASVREPTGAKPAGGKSSFFLEDPSVELNSTVMLGTQERADVVVATSFWPTGDILPDSLSDVEPTQPDPRPPVVELASMSRSARGHFENPPALSPGRDAQPRRAESAVDADVHAAHRHSFIDEEQEVPPRLHEPSEPALASPEPFASPPPRPLFSKFLPRPDVPDEGTAAATPLMPSKSSAPDAAPMPSKSASVSRSGSRRNLPDVLPLGHSEPVPAVETVDTKSVPIEPPVDDKEREKREREAAQQAQIKAITQANPLLQEYMARAAAQRAETERKGPALPAPDVEDTESVDYGAGETISAMSETESSSRS